MEAEANGLAQNNSNVIAWFVGGALLGAAVALLLAPDSGDETRRKLLKQAQKSSKKLGESSQDIVEKGRELYERGRELAEEAADLFEKGRRIAEKKIDSVI
ncbi:MAG TPA: YtxH domain-containing protein [Bryobacteraceae bacterium]|jgi:gas vesicle protein|nr:YtxH domain-containing protein [Bryobacteraceae bacterium]